MKKTKNLKSFEPLFFLGYGSLLWPAGINGRGLHQKYTAKNLIPVRLNGYKRGLSSYYQGRNFYGLLPEKSSSLNGVMFPIATKRDYRALLFNEGALKTFGKYQVYWPTRVTNKVELPVDFTMPAGWRIMTLVCKEDRTGLGSVTPWYISRCEEFAGRWGDEFLDDFYETGGVSLKQWSKMQNKEGASTRERRNRR